MLPLPEQKKNDWLSILKRNNALTIENIRKALNHVNDEERLALLAEQQRLEAKYSNRKPSGGGGFGVRNQQVEIPPEHQFFAQNLPHKPWCSDDLQQGLMVRPKQQALAKKYLQYNPPAQVKIMVFDIDRQVNGVEYFEQHNAPKPNRIVGNPENRHAHALYFLEAGVCRSDAARLKPLKFLTAVEGALCRLLEADPGFAGLVTKNPLHPSWETLVVHDHLYSLAEMADRLDLSAASANEKVYRDAGVGRNVLTFDEVRVWAYSSIRGYWGPGGFQGWLQAVTERVAGVNCQFPQPLPFAETQAIAKSIAKWTWARITPAGFHEAQAARGRRSGAVRREASEQDRGTAKRLRAQGRSIRQIAEELMVSVGTVHSWVLGVQ